MPRCTSSNKFASMDEAEAEVDDESISEGLYHADVRVTRLCGECSEEMMELTFEAETDIVCDMCSPECGGHYGEDRDLPDGMLPSDKLPEGHADYQLSAPDFEVDSSDAEVDDYTQTTDRRGKPIKNYRYAKHLFKVTVTGTATCQCCDAEIEFTAESGEEPASAFESLVD